MFKSARWRSEKNKIKAVFRLQFHVTQLKQLAGDTLIISIIPADTGKPTTRLEKAKVKDGNCYWEKPHCETVKFVQDPKNGNFHEKIYHFSLATGSSKSSGIGEVSIDFASFAEATKTSSLSLPLKNANCAAILHVSIQRVQESLDQRDFDKSENANREDRSLRAQLTNGNTEEIIQSNLNEDCEVLNDNINRDNRTSSGSDLTLSGSDHEQPPPATIHEEHEHEHEHERASQWDWLEGSPPELSTDESSLSEEGSPDAMIKKLKIELDVLARQVDVSELELQTLRKQIVKERKKGQDLSREVDELKEERNAFKEECEKLSEESKVKVKVKVNNGDPWDLVDELRQELNYEKDLNSNLRLQLQKTQESNSELILAVQDLEEMLEQKDSEKSKSKSKSTEVKSEIDDDEDQKALEDIVREHSGMQEAFLLEQKITDLYGEIEMYKRDKDELEMQMDQIALDYEILKQGNHDMSYKLEQSQLQEQLKMQYECGTYTVVNELESKIESLNNELKMKSKELSDSFLAIEELKTYVKNLEKDLEDQENGFEADIEDLMNEKVKQEQRAIRAEESMRKMKIQNANTAERLQEDFRKLSTQMNSSFEANEKVAMKAMEEANHLRVEKRYLEDMVKKVKQDLDFFRVHHEEKLVDLLKQITLKSKQLEKMEKQMEDLSSICRTKIENLEDERKNLESEVHFVKMELEKSKKELTELTDANKQKDCENELLHSEIESLESRYNDMKLSIAEDESEKEKMKIQISQLKGEVKKRQDELNLMEKKLKDSSNRVIMLEGLSKAASRNTPKSSKEVTNLKNKIELLEGQIKMKDTALKSSESSFHEKEKDLQHKIKELETRLEDLDQSIAISQASRAEEIALLKKLNKSMEEELLEMQERYSEISLKFAEVEGERQKLVMTLRNVKNAKKSQR
ncbi:unnamed protein product [Lactuca virosa]|uniref:C2 NT-type domain-containing protein n=1 Tax=Lactuca virosa TaxID=75947 RepID=A0AAU9PM07_9ASTR|nr:unnamed protein product [Lactuca virosa]